MDGFLPRREAIEQVPRIACLCSALENWALETRLGFSADQYTNNTINTAATDPLLNYDVIYNTSQGYPADTPANANVRARYAAFFERGGGYVGARINGANFVAPETGGAQLAGLQAESQGRRSQAGKATEDVEQLLETFGRVTPVLQEDVSGIVYWDNEGGESSPITGAYPARDTALVEDPVWFTDVPGRRRGRRPPAGVRLPRVRPLAEPRPVGRWLAGDRPRAEHREHRTDHAVRDRPALPGPSRAQLPGSVRGLLLGRHLTEAGSGLAFEHARMQDLTPLPTR